MKKTFSKFSELVKYCEDNKCDGLMKIHKNDGQTKSYQNLAHYSFLEGYNTIEVEEPKTEREKVADMLTKNEFVKHIATGRSHPTISFYLSMAGDEVVGNYNHWELKEFLERFAPSTREEWEKSLYGE